MDVFIMTILISYECACPHIFIFQPNMDKNTVKTSKLNSSPSLPSDHGGFKNYSVLSRCNSFSSCSNDSSVYSGSNPIQTRFTRSAKRTIINQPTGTRKRSRNSSGSSISSNISGISDKDLKSAGIISKTKTEVKNCIINDTKAPQLKYTKVNSSKVELKEETIVNEEIDCSKNSLVILPNRHNLRGKITKKGCTCCPSTCATVVLRRYKRYIKTDDKTVISSTKVKTYIEKKPNISPVNEKSRTSSAKSKGRKRRSEIEKLYDSLHEIQWAKDFSPDNILRQINVRQAASCSVFGRPSSHPDPSPDRKSKKQKNINNLNNSSLIESSSKIDPEHGDSNSCKVISNMNKTCMMTNCGNENITDLQTTEIMSSDIYHCGQSCKSCNSHSSVNITSCSVSHINVKEININSRESVLTQSIVTENGVDYSDDAQLSYTSDESSSAVSSSIVNLQSKHLLDFKYKNKNSGNLSDADLSEYSTPTFFDIAEEGIRTIDACFREVGAEVVVSTCYDEESSLPLLTSVRENKASSKVLNDNPPVLEPCVTIEFNHNIKEALIENENNQIEIRNNFKKYSNFPKSSCLIDPNKGKKYDSERITSNECDCQKDAGFQGFKKRHPFSKLCYKTARKVIKKYFKLSQRKVKLKGSNITTLQTKSSMCNKTIKLPNTSDKHFYSINVCSNRKGNKTLDDTHNSVLLPSTSSNSDETSSDTSDQKLNESVYHEISDEKYSRNDVKEGIILDSTKDNSYLYNREKVFKYPSSIKKVSIVSQTSTSQTTSVITTFDSTKIETTNRIHEEHISRPTPLFGFSSEYKSIKVNRSYNYTHVILLVTRGKSIFLTLEALRELKDALNRTNNDSNCQVLVINGVGDSFCLGLDLKPLVGPRKKIASTEIAVAIKELVEALSDFKKPLAAVVNGPALGLGMTLLNHADLTIASDKATFCMPYSYLGYMPEGGATLTLPQVVGSTVAMDLLLRGKTLTAREACNVGLISEVVEAKRLPYELVSRVRTLAENSLCALETTKALLKMQLHVNLQLVLENEVKLLPRMWLTRTCQDSLRRALQSGILSE